MSAIVFHKDAAKQMSRVIQQLCNRTCLQIFDLRRQMGVLDDPPTHIYFDWSEPMIPFSILMSYLHIIIVFILLRVIDVRANGGKVSDVFMKR